MQPNPYSNDPNYSQPTETNPPIAPNQQGGQYAQPQSPNQAGEPTLPNLSEGQQSGQYVQPQSRYTIQPAQAPQGAGMSEGEAGKFAIGKIIDFIRWLIVALELLFLLRFVLELIGADPQNLFAQFLYALTGFFLYIFLGIVPNTHLGTKGIAFIDWSTLIGMAVYGIVYMILRLFLRTTISRPQEPL